MSRTANAGPVTTEVSSSGKQISSIIRQSNARSARDEDSDDEPDATPETMPLHSEAEFRRAYKIRSDDEIHSRMLHQQRTARKRKLERDFSTSFVARHGEWLAEAVTLLGDRMPILRWLPKYQWRTMLRADLVSGIIIGIMLVPQAMAYGMLAGLPPVYGLYSSIMPSVVYMCTGTCRHLQLGTCAPSSMLTADIVQPVVAAQCALPESAECIEATIQASLLLSVFVGSIYWLMGVLRFSLITAFMPNPVLMGFTTGAAFQIVTSNLKIFLGLNVPRASSLLQWHYILSHWSSINVMELVLGCLSLLVMTLIGNLNKKLKLTFPIPEQLVVLVLGVLAVHLGSLDERFGVAVVGEIPQGLYTPRIPVLPAAQMLQLLHGALVTAMVIYMVSVSVAKSLGNAGGYPVDANQELFALGAASIVGGLTGAYPPSGSFCRSALVSSLAPEHGSPLHSLVSAAMVAVVCVSFTSMLHFLPKTVLASIIFMALKGMVKVTEARVLWRVSRVEFALWMVAACSTGLFGVQYGILFSIGSSVMVLLNNQARPQVSVLGYIGRSDTFRDAAVYPRAKHVPGILIFRFYASMHFANSDYFETAVTERIAQDSTMGVEYHSVIIDATSVNSIDTTAIAMLQKLASTLRVRAIDLSLARLQTCCVSMAIAAGLHLNGVPEDRWYLSLQDAVLASHNRQQHALGGAMTVELYVDSPSPAPLPDDSAGREPDAILLAQKPAQIITQGIRSTAKRD